MVELPIDLVFGEEALLPADAAEQQEGQNEAAPKQHSEHVVPLVGVAGFAAHCHDLRLSDLSELIGFRLFDIYLYLYLSVWVYRFF